MDEKDEEEVEQRERGKSPKVSCSSGVNHQNTGNQNEVGNSSNMGQNRSEMGGRKLELPIFIGEDPYGWVFRIER